MDGALNVDMKNLLKWDNEILLKNFMTHLLSMNERGKRVTTAAYKQMLEKHHVMLKEIKRRMK